MSSIAEEKDSRLAIEVKTVPHGSDEYTQTTRLRDDVLRRPLGLALTPEELAKETGEYHVAAFDSESGELVGCLVLVPVSSEVLKMRQVAVAPGWQGQGIGHRLVAFSERLARKWGFGQMTLHARTTAVPFYLQQGYAVVGDEFEEVTIPHVTMIKMMKPIEADAVSETQL